MPDQAWYITQRWQQYRAELRANLLRTVAVGALYSVHLWSYFSSQGRLVEWTFLQIAPVGTVPRQFHIAVTLVALAWAMLCLCIWLSLKQKFFPHWFPFFSTGWDLVLLTSLLCLSPGPRSPLVSAYFLIIVLAALRLSLPLVRFATIGSMIGYLVVLGAAKWPVTLNKIADVQSVPRYHQLIVLFALFLTGVMLGQLIRRLPEIAREYAVRSGGEGNAP